MKVERFSSDISPKGPRLKMMQPGPEWTPLSKGLFSLLSQEFRAQTDSFELTHKLQGYFLNHGIRLKISEVESFLDAILATSAPSALASILSGRQTLRTQDANPTAVAWVQDRLRELGFLIDDGNGKYRGHYGAQTQQAVRQFQGVVGLKQDGVVGRQTLSALLTAEPLQLPQGVSAKTGTILFRLHEKIIEKLPNIVAIWHELGAPTPVLTSGNDSKHAGHSKHYQNRAIDLRGNNVSDSLLKKMAERLGDEMGEDYFVQAEFFPDNPANDHIHMQYNKPDY